MGSVYSYARIRLLLVTFCGWAVKMFDLLIYNVFVQLCKTNVCICPFAEDQSNGIQFHISMVIFVWSWSYAKTCDHYSSTVREE